MLEDAEIPAPVTMLGTLSLSIAPPMLRTALILESPMRDRYLESHMKSYDLGVV